jgi:very-long-chain (3R)-3-hydroxyacyl-CoA dehydratase
MASGLRTAYLALYNAACQAGWAYVLWLIVQHLAVERQPASTLYAAIAAPLQIVQTAALLEVVHAALGLVRSGVATTAMQGASGARQPESTAVVTWGAPALARPLHSPQMLSRLSSTAVASRLLVLWGIVFLAPPAQVGSAFALMAASWALVEVPRYGFYLWGLLSSSVPRWLTVLRYSLFLVLYPTGISGEVGCLWNSLHFIKEHGIGEVALPNAHNVAFSWHTALWAILTVVYPVGSYVMYSHMLHQRRKVLSAAASAKAKAG